MKGELISKKVEDVSECQSCTCRLLTAHRADRAVADREMVVSLITLH
jgi:hypothetical protein